MYHPSNQESYTYVVRNPESPLTSPDIDDVHHQSLEVTVTWCNDVLFHSHLPPNAPFYLGNPPSVSRAWRQSRLHPSHYLLPQEVLGAGALRLIAETEHGASLLVGSLPPTATFVSESGASNLSEFRTFCEDRGWFDEHSNCHYWPLRNGAIRLTLGAFHVDCRKTAAAKPVPRALLSHLEGESLTYLGLSFASTAAILASAAFFAPPLGLTANEGIDRNDLILMQQYLDAAAEREREIQEATPTTEDSPAAQSGETGQRAEHSEGKMGAPQSAQSNRRYAVKGPPDNPDPHLARDRAVQDALTFGTIGLLHSVTADPNAPTVDWGRDTSLGMDMESAMGNMWADDIGQAYGAGGVGLTGAASGGGGVGHGIGLGEIGTFNRGLGSGGDYSFGQHHGRLIGSRPTKPVFRMRAATPTVSGRLPPEVIQRIVRQNHGRFRACYEKGLSANPSLSGRVSVRFVIGRNGAVSNVSNGGASIGSSEVASCVVQAFYGLSFPKPEGGIVTVSYPIAFSPE